MDVLSKLPKLKTDKETVTEEVKRSAGLTEPNTFNDMFRQQKINV